LIYATRIWIKGVKDALSFYRDHSDPRRLGLGNAAHLVCVNNDRVECIITLTDQFWEPRMKLVFVTLAVPFLISASDAAIEVGNQCTSVIAKEQLQKKLLLSAVQRYQSCIQEDQNSAKCLQSYDKMSVLYRDYRNSTLDYVQGC